jgi:hypothetical protein
MTVLVAGEEEQGGTNVPDALDRGDRFRSNPESRSDLKEEERCKNGSHRPEANRDTVDHGLSQAWIDRLENESLDWKRGCTQNSSSASLGAPGN